MQFPRAGPALTFPDPNLADEEGLVLVGGELSVDFLVAAYSQGVFPWTARPVSWWSPDPRGIFELDQFHLPRSVERMIRRSTFEVKVDRAFEEVIRACAAPAPGRRTTWIAASFIEAYTRLHRAGYAHSVECWLDGALVGGIYGVALGGLFAGESMFHRVSGASKVALASLARMLKEAGFELFDIQMVTPATLQFGAIEIPRRLFLERLRKAVAKQVRFPGAEGPGTGQK